MRDIRPKWVIVNDTLCDVSDFANLPYNKRPECFCPECKEPVTLKLGKVRAHHFAHRPDAYCQISSGESALHLNVKFHIYKQLQDVNQLVVENHCTGYCERSQKIVVLKNWNHIEVEYSVGDFRPDLAFIKDDKVIGAIEVLVSHEVNDEKAQFYQDQQITWLEVPAYESLYEGGDYWTADKPIEYRTIWPSIRKWKCDHCKRKEEKQRKKREYKKKNYTETHASKMVDLYYPSGRKYREVFYVKKRVKDGQWTTAWVEREGFKKIAEVFGSPITEELLASLNKRVSEYIGSKKSKTLQVDTWEWKKWERGSKYHPADLDRYPFKYVWDNKGKQWNKLDIEPKLEMLAFFRPSTSINKQHHQPSDEEEEWNTEANLTQVLATCMICGKQTTDHWWYSGETNLCKCKKCFREGKKLGD